MVPVEGAPPAAVFGSVETESSSDGMTVSVVDWLTPPYVAVSVTGVLEFTGSVVTLKVAEPLPAGTVTDGLTVAAAVSLLASVTAAPPGGANPVSVIVPFEETPLVTLVGLTETDASVAGLTVSIVDWLAPPAVAVMVTAALAATPSVAIGKFADDLPWATMTEGFTVAALVSLLVSVTAVPPVGAFPVSVTFPTDATPPATLVGAAV